MLEGLGSETKWSNKNYGRSASAFMWRVEDWTRECYVRLNFFNWSKSLQNVGKKGLPGDKQFIGYQSKKSKKIKIYVEITCQGQNTQAYFAGFVSEQEEIVL